MEADKDGDIGKQLQEVDALVKGGIEGLEKLAAIQKGGSALPQLVQVLKAVYRTLELSNRVNALTANHLMTQCSGLQLRTGIMAMMLEEKGTFGPGELVETIKKHVQVQKEEAEARQAETAKAAAPPTEPGPGEPIVAVANSLAVKTVYGPA